MNIKNQVGFGTGIIIIANIISIWYPGSYHIFTSLSALVLCLLIYNLDVSEYDGSLYYELGFTYTIISIVCSLVVIGLLENEEDGLKLILGNFGIALTTSAWGMILKVLSKKESSAKKIQDYNDALEEMTSKMKFMGDDVIQTFVELKDKLEQQSGFLDDMIEKHSSIIQEQNEGMLATQNKFKNNVEKISGDYEEKINGQIDIFDQAFLKNSSIIDDFKIRTDESLAELEKSLATVDNFRNDIKDTLIDHLSKIETSNSELNSRIDSINESVIETSESNDLIKKKLQELVSDENDIFEKVNSLETEIVKNHSAQEEYSTDLKSKISEITNTISKIEKGKNINKSLEILNDNISELETHLDVRIANIENLMKDQKKTRPFVKKELEDLKTTRAENKKKHGFIRKIFKW